MQFFDTKIIFLQFFIFYLFLISYLDTATPPLLNALYKDIFNNVAFLTSHLYAKCEATPHPTTPPPTLVRPFRLRRYAICSDMFNPAPGKLEKVVASLTFLTNVFQNRSTESSFFSFLPPNFSLFPFLSLSVAPSNRFSMT